MIALIKNIAFKLLNDQNFEIEEAYKDSKLDK